jgi:hypothetical protein
LPRIAILAPESPSIFFKVFPRGPISKPTSSEKKELGVSRLSSRLDG